jgi:hypothetical protein
MHDIFAGREHALAFLQAVSSIRGGLSEPIGRSQHRSSTPLFPKAILQAEFAANREVLASKRERLRAKRVAKQPLTHARNE